MIEILRSDTAFLALRPGWQALWLSLPEASPFLSPAWIYAWWAAFGNEAPRVVVQREGGDMAGVLPLYGLDGRLLPMGAGITDYTDALLGPAAAASALLEAALAEGLTCDLPDLPPDSALLNAAPPVSWQETRWDCEPCPVLTLDPTLSGVPKAMQRDLRQARNRAERKGGWTLLNAETHGTEPLLAALLRLHGSRWEARGEAGVLADPAVRRFHTASLPALAACGALRLRAVEIGGRIAAVIHALLAGRTRILFYLSGFDAAFGYESPGTVLLGAMLEEAAAEGRTEAHFLRGRERYKYAWGAQDRPNIGRRLVPP